MSGLSSAALSLDDLLADVNNLSEVATQITEDERIQLTLDELHGFVGAGGGQILVSVKGALHDVSAARELFFPGGKYALLAGREVSRCLAARSFDMSLLDDISWAPSTAEETQHLRDWQEKLSSRFPIIGELLAKPAEAVSNALRQRGVAAASKAAQDIANAVETARRGSAGSAFTVRIDKTSNAKLGLDLDQEKMIVHGLKQDGLLAQWNDGLSADDSRRIRVGDKLLEVNKQCDPAGAMAELAKAQWLDLTFQRQEVDAKAGGNAEAEGTAKCPISGKEGMACPMSMFLPTPPQKKESGDSSKPSAKSGFMAGKSLIAEVAKTNVSQSSWEGTLLYKLCPLNWDANTCKMVALITAVSWLSGLAFGWKLRAMIKG